MANIDTEQYCFWVCVWMLVAVAAAWKAFFGKNENVQPVDHFWAIYFRSLSLSLSSPSL